MARAQSASVLARSAKLPTGYTCTFFVATAAKNTRLYERHRRQGGILQSLDGQQ